VPLGMEEITIDILGKMRLLSIVSSLPKTCEPLIPNHLVPIYLPILDNNATHSTWIELIELMSAGYFL